MAFALFKPSRITKAHGPAFRIGCNFYAAPVVSGTTVGVGAGFQF